MSLLNVLLNPLKEIAGKVMTNGKLAPVELANRRLRICNACPHLLKKTQNCKKCACFVDVKLKYLDQRCKLNLFFHCEHL